MSKLQKGHLKEHELLWAILPEGLEKNFEVESFSKEAKAFQIVLVEKNIVPTNLPAIYQGRQIKNNVLSSKTINDFTLRGRKTEIVIRKRYWKYEGVKEMYTRPLDVVFPGTTLAKEFGIFLKGTD